MTLSSFVWVQYQHVTEERPDGRICRNYYSTLHYYKLSVLTLRIFEYLCLFQLYIQLHHYADFKYDKNKMEQI